MRLRIRKYLMGDDTDGKALNTRLCDMIVPSKANENRRHRLPKYVDWLRSRGREWYASGLAACRDHLLEDLAPSSVSAHLSTVRSRYREMVRSRARRDELYALAGRKLEALGQQDTPANCKAFVDERLTRLKNQLDPQAAPGAVPTSQDKADEAHHRLTPSQATTLVSAPGFDTLRGLRDSAAIGLMLCTGIREFGLSGLEVRDLRRHTGDRLALHVTKGKACKERRVPYGSMDWVLGIADAWCAEAGIEEGPVPRGFWKRNKSLRPGPLSLRVIQHLLKRYPIVIDGELVAVKPHDLRRTYARLLYEAGMDPVQIQQNLGHADIDTALGYIGTLNAEQREPPAVFRVDLSELYEERVVNR